MFTKVSAAAAAGLLATAQAQLFTLNCAPLLVERGDPIIKPGLPNDNSHVHTIVGGTGFNLSMSLTLAPDSANTTCNRPLDHSNYWQPALYNQASNNSFEYIPFEGSAIYYFNRACDYAPGRTKCPADFKPKAPPAGLRIISGNSTFRKPEYDASSKSAQAIKTVCERSDGKSASYPGLPTEACDRVLATSFFPSCWNGKDLDSPDHFAHMAWPVQSYNGGVCPESHPTAIYSVFYQFFYNTKNFPNWKQWVFAMGDIQGYGLHGDFLQGWTNQTALEQAVYTCDGPNGPDKAPCSTAEGIGRAISMPAEYPRVNEDVGLEAPIHDLPGYHPIVGTWEDRMPALK